MLSLIEKIITREFLDFLIVLIKMSFSDVDLDLESSEISFNVIQNEKFFSINHSKVIVLFLLGDEDAILLISNRKEEVCLTFFHLDYVGEDQLSVKERANILFEFFDKEIKPKLSSEIVLPAILLENCFTTETRTNFPDYRW